MKPWWRRIEPTPIEETDAPCGALAPAVEGRASLAEPLTGNDVAWARMDVPGQPMVVTLVLLLDRPLTEERVRMTLRSRLLPLERFRQRVAWVGGRYRWLEDAPLDWSAHLERVRLPEPADQRTLEEQVGRWAGEPLVFDRPLWRCYLVENCGAGCALVFRAHHCIADGVALLRVFLALTDRAPGSGPATLAERREQARLAAKTGRLLGPPPGRWARLRWSAAFGAALLRQLCLGPDPRTALRGRLNGRKRVAWSAPVPLTDIALIRERLGGRVNDIMLVLVMGALGRYLLARGGLKKNMAIKLLVPINLRPYQEDIRLGNEFGAILLKLPLTIADPVERLREVRRRMDRIKGTPEALANRLILDLARWLPGWLERLVLRGFGMKATAVMTNVPGPERPLFLAGAPLGRVLAWVPQIAGMGIGLSVLSYAGAVTLGVTTDSGVVADPWELVAGFEAELARLLAGAGAGRGR